MMAWPTIFWRSLLAGALSVSLCDIATSIPSHAQTAARAASPPGQASNEAGGLHRLGKDHFRKGEVQQAIELYSKAIKLHPEQADAWIDRGTARFVEGKLDAAVADFDRGIGLLPASATPEERAEARAQRSKALLHLGRLHSALADLDVAAALVPRSGKMLVTRAHAHVVAKSYAAALADVERTIALGTHLTEATVAQAVRATVLARTQRYSEAEGELRDMAPIPTITRIAIGYVRSHYMLGYSADAPMTMRLVRLADGACEPSCPEWIALQGRIVSGQQADFARLVNRLGDKTPPILIDSNGGSIEAAMAMGRMIRERNLDVVVARTDFFAACPDNDPACKGRKQSDRVLGIASNIAARCASACVYILSAGQQRIVGSLAGVGVHRTTFYRKYSSPPDAKRLEDDRRKGRIIVTSAGEPRALSAGSDDTYIKTLQYYRDMGIDASIMEHLLAAPADSMNWLSMTDLVSIGLATGSGFVEQYFSGKSPPPPVVTLSAPVKTDPAATRLDLIRDLNRELVRLGCMSPPRDVQVWSASSTAALRRYGVLMGRSMSSAEPVQADLDRLKRHGRPVCPSPCPAGTVERDRLCLTDPAKKS